MDATTPLNFRIATPSDAPQIALLIQSAFRHVHHQDTRWTGPDPELNRRFTLTAEEVLPTITNPAAAFLVATTTNDDDDTTTIIATMAAIKKTPSLARLAMLAVDPQLQASGLRLGRRVLAHTEEYAINTWGVTTLGLDALNTRGLLIEWYERRGYEKTGEKSPFPVEALKGLEGEVTKDLHFVEMEKVVGGEKSGVGS
jgi:ribosomal protein S18 acetylase RimI-like enzyme